MRKTPIVLFCCLPLMAYSQVLDFVSLNTRQIEQLDRSKTVVIIPGGILEEHGPYLPSGSDGIFNQRLADDLAVFVASKSGWTAVMFPQIPLGAGAANEMGAKYSFPGSCTVLPSTLRAVFMDLADQLGKAGISLGLHRAWSRRPGAQSNSRPSR